MTTVPTVTRQNQWVNIIFFAVTTLGGVVGAPLYIYYNGIAAAEIWLALAFFVISGLGITVGYHRYFAHATFKTNKFVRFLLLFAGSAAFEQSALEWSSQHRDHHKYVDTDRDPYSIRKGFFYAHMGWLIFWKHDTDYGNVKNLSNDPMIVHQHRYYALWATTAGILTPAAIGWMTGHLLGALLIAVCLRLTLVYHATFFINSVCHTFGKATYDVDATAKDNWLVAFLTFGEGYHNFHHRFGGDYRNGVRWYQFDPSKWTIALLEKLGLAWDLKRVSDFRIMAARLDGEKTRLDSWLEETADASHRLRANFGEQAARRYERLRQRLVDWEAAAKEQRKVLQGQVSNYSDDIRESARRRVAEAKARFQEARADWNSLLRECPVAA